MSGRSSPPRRNRDDAFTSPAPDFDEPFENEDIFEDENPMEDEEEGEGEELFGDRLEADYQPVPHLDRYDPNILDEDQYSDLSMGDRAAAEMEMNKRDRAAGIIGSDLMYDESDEEDENRTQKRRRAEKAAAGEMDMDEQMESVEGLRNTEGYSVKEWVQLPGPSTEIKNRFKKLLRTFMDDNGQYVYKERIRNMCHYNQSSFVVEFPIIASTDFALGYFLPEAPFQMLELFNIVAKELVISMYPTYERVSSEISVRISELPLVEEINCFRRLHLNQLVRTLGVISASSGVLPQLSVTLYDCIKCTGVVGPIIQTQTTESKPTSCPQCHSAGPFVGFPVFSTVLMANHMQVKDSKDVLDSLTEDDIKQIIQLSKDPRIGHRIVASIAPSIYGHDDIKRSLALAIFGGRAKNPGQKHKIRGDINVLLCGDPGTAKSQFLKYIEKLAPRAVYTTGQGASAVGLTAYVKKSFKTKDWTLEAGALVLADRGVCLIDEFDKMNDQDRTSIHEAMEQQSISISKAGINTSLQARCSVIAAANPISGSYDPTMTFFQNVDLSEPILSRFDILCVVKDEADPMKDAHLAKFVVNSHMKHHPNYTKKGTDEIAENFVGRDKPIDQTLLKKYILYAKRNVEPELGQMDQEKIAKFYSKLRQASMKTACLPVTVRQIESIVRMAEASAKMHLRDSVLDDDVNMAIRLVLENFVSCQKMSLMKQMTIEFSSYLSYQKDNNELLYYILRQMVLEYLAFQRATGGRTQSIEISERAFRNKAKQVEVYDLTSFYDSDEFKNNNFVYSADRRVIIQTLPDEMEE